MAPKVTPEEIRIRRLSKPLPNGCIEWQGARDKDGYALFTPKRGHLVRLARYLLGKKLGAPLQRHVLACHKCSNTSCVNVDHLFPGTNQDNMDDGVKKREFVHGAAHHKTTLTEQQVREIRAAPRGGPILARKYGVHPTTIHAIRTRYTWRHLD